MDAATTPPSSRRSRIWLLVAGVLLVAAACGLGAVILARPIPFAVDTGWNSLLVANSSMFLDGFSRVMNFLGGTWFGVLVVPIGCAIALILLRRAWSAAFFLTAEAASAGAVQVLKHLFGRARPEDIIIISDYGSFPSGHVANAATLATVAVLLFPRLWVLLVGIAWVLLMALSRTALHAHWLSDTLGGALIGVGVVLIVGALFAPLIARERSVSPAPLRQ
ncbi:MULTISPECIES: phosphatase PAP2 family protein [unclassified Microbacterium]|uniref:phosphatase PAP2 family protein n=1 Tax=unclassified Microbacterium TaxID=2609290 RepID=UPI00214B1DD1|nr:MULTISPECIES: phosphatase PAP2 family protein [unclassified Microbacterium]MCR2810339.1 phosphatase PAP2 family protein [Microbacterium sp. zg.B185]WIM18398.1 phosphatase PAP2 family protein [Microbacterium sp. zg-B185]